MANHLRDSSAGELRNARGLSISILENGAIGRIAKGDISVSLFAGTPLEAGPACVYLRALGSAGVESAWPLLGPAAPSQAIVEDGRAVWAADNGRLSCRLSLVLDPAADVWAWVAAVRNRGEERVTADVVLAQDVGLARREAVHSSEAFTSQYIDHTVIRHTEAGPVILSRQNLPQDGRNPWLMLGCWTGAAGFLTDGFQFYGTSFKATGAPAALAALELPNAVRQYELAMPCLSSCPVALGPGEEREVAFFQRFEDHHPGASGADDLARVPAAGPFVERARAGTGAGRPPGRPPRTLFTVAPFLPARELEEREVRRAYGGSMRNVEMLGGEIASFFTGEATHVVLRRKEACAERPHGHIMLGASGVAADDRCLASTAYMFGCFCAQTAIGNTNFNRILGVCRHPLNAARSSGLRLFVERGGRFRILGLPSSFGMSPRSARWTYATAEGGITVEARVAADCPAVELEIDTTGLSPTRFLASMEVVFGADAEGLVPVIQEARDGMRIGPAPGSTVAVRYPEAWALVSAGDPEAVDAFGDDGMLFEDGRSRGLPFVAVRTRAVRRFTLRIRAGLSADGAGSASSDRPWLSAYRPVPRVAIPTDPAAESFWNDTLAWFAHDAFIHFRSPHGLEQYSGAAWGVRDVTQGPLEMLLATGQAAAARRILLTVFAHQYRGSGEWPQWFMFDAYHEVQARESHGDVVLWPLAGLCRYIESTNDLSLLDERVGYTDGESLAHTGPEEPVRAHLERLLGAVRSSFLPGTHLPRYGNGDWDDTVQPADPGMKDSMTSGWTVELLCQTLRQYEAVLVHDGRAPEAARVAELADGVARDFRRFLMPGGVVAGFLQFPPSGAPRALLHPDDPRTGIRYRLLPMTQGILSGLFDPAEAARHLDIVARSLLFPDGARLMDAPARYRGGVCVDFKRAEAAANFGREIGLMYTHASLRLVEALAMVGRGEEAFRLLATASPVQIRDRVPNAVPRQANAYFSSSDGDFSDRAEAAARFSALRDGAAPVKGGWRIYSSGPGIFVATLVTGLFGLRRSFDGLVVDPVLPRAMDGATLACSHLGADAVFVFHVGGGRRTRRVEVNGQSLPVIGTPPNPYRTGGAVLDWDGFQRLLRPGGNVVQVWS
jgi:1,2-beta-oligoglucan phosphorylase